MASSPSERAVAYKIREVNNGAINRKGAFTITMFKHFAFVVDVVEDGIIVILRIRLLVWWLGAMWSVRGSRDLPKEVRLQGRTVGIGGDVGTVSVPETNIYCTITNHNDRCSWS